MTKESRRTIDRLNQALEEAGIGQQPREPRRIYYCAICGKNPVDAESGFDTCEESVGKI